MIDLRGVLGDGWGEVLGTESVVILRELGWDALYDGRWHQILRHFCDPSKSKAPDYLYQEIPEQQTIDYSLRYTRCHEPRGRIRFFSSYFSNIMSE